jgi:hypothetical protein
MVAKVEAATPMVVAEKVAVIAPSGTVTLGGTAATALSLDNDTVAPPAGAMLLRVTVPVEGWPPVTLVGLMVRSQSTGGLMVSAAVCVPLKVPVTVTTVSPATALVLTIKVALVSPAATVTLGGVVAKELSSDKVTRAPPAGAGLLRTTVPVEELPPGTLAGLIDRDESTGEPMAREAVRVTPPKVAETVAVVEVPTATVVTVKVAVVSPWATVTPAGVVEDGLSSERVTRIPPTGAGLLRVTVPVEEAPPVTPVGFMVKSKRTGGLTVRVAVCVALNSPVTVTVVSAPTALVLTVKVALVSPAATVTVAGVVADELSSDKVTRAPPAGAGLLMVTVPVEESPPVTEAGLRDTEVRTAGLMVRVAVCVPL